MLGKDELIKSLEEINEKRLLSHEVTEVLDPFKEEESLDDTHVECRRRR